MTVCVIKLTLVAVDAQDLVEIRLTIIDISCFEWFYFNLNIFKRMLFNVSISPEVSSANTVDLKPSFSIFPLLL